MDHDEAVRPTEFAVGWEELPWNHDPDPSASRRQRLAARGPYLAAVPSRIAGSKLRVDGELLAEAEDAVREIARFDSELDSIAERRRALEGSDAPVEFAPLTSVLLRTESASSSEIEGVTAGARALALAAIGADTGPNAQLVTANTVAMRRALGLADDINLEAILAVHEALLDGHQYASPGELRDRQVWIGAGAASPHTAIFVPPHHVRIPAAMEDLVAFVGRVDLPVLAQVAIAHAQFETIHPFNDGNGRVGRALVHAMLRHSGVTRVLTLPISAGLLIDTAGYFEALTEYRVGRVEPIIRRFVDASFEAIREGRLLVEELQKVYTRWSDSLSSRRGSAARRMLPHLLNQPAVTVALVQSTLGVAQSAAQRAIDQLEGAGILARADGGRRNRVWLARDALDALDGFAERVGRRR